MNKIFYIHKYVRLNGLWEMTFIYHIADIHYLMNDLMQIKLLSQLVSSICFDCDGFRGGKF